jgi:cytochrome c-type biogenesis protein CcmH/NrfF
MRSRKRLPPVVFLVLGWIILAVASAWTCYNVNFLTRAERAVGEVVRLEQHRGTGRSKQPTYAPVFEFKNSRERLHQVEELVRTGTAAHPVGSKVIVRYWPESPEYARIQSFSTLWLAPVGFFAVGGCFLAIAAFRKRVKQAGG